MNGTVLITGISGDIGYTIAKKFFQENWTIIGTYAHDSHRIERVRRDLKGAKIIKCDFSDINQAIEVFKDFPDIYTPDVLINAAGIVSDDFFVRMDSSDWERVIDVNLISSIIVSSSVFKKMKKRGKGKIINLSSISGVYGRDTQTNYSTSKGGLIGLTQLIENLAKGHENISAITIAPGMIETDIIKQVDSKKMSLFLSSLTENRLGTPSEVANLVYSLCQSNISYINGECISIDGGAFL